MRKPADARIDNMDGNENNIDGAKSESVNNNNVMEMTADELSKFLGDVVTSFWSKKRKKCVDN